MKRFLYCHSNKDDIGEVSFTPGRFYEAKVSDSGLWVTTDNGYTNFITLFRDTRNFQTVDDHSGWSGIFTEKIKPSLVVNYIKKHKLV